MKFLGSFTFALIAAAAGAADAAAIGPGVGNELVARGYEQPKPILTTICKVYTVKPTSTKKTTTKKITKKSTTKKTTKTTKTPTQKPSTKKTSTCTKTTSTKKTTTAKPSTSTTSTSSFTTASSTSTDTTSATSSSTTSSATTSTTSSDTTSNTSTQPTPTPAHICPDKSDTIIYSEVLANAYEFDDDIFNLKTPFDFQLGANTYDQLSISMNGAIFGGEIGPRAQNPVQDIPLPYPYYFSDTVFAYHLDMKIRTEEEESMLTYTVTRNPTTGVRTVMVYWKAHELTGPYEDKYVFRTYIREDSPGKVWAEYVEMPDGGAGGTVGWQTKQGADQTTTTYARKKQIILPGLWLEWDTTLGTIKPVSCGTAAPA